MRILLISKEYPFSTKSRFGGGGSHVFYLAYALAKKGHAVCIIAQDGSTKHGSPLENFNDVEVVGCDWGKGEDLAPEGAKKGAEGAVESALTRCRKFNPDVIHAHHLQGCFVGLAAAAAYKRPLIVTMHKPPRLADEALGANAPAYQRQRFYALWHLLATDQRVCAHVAYSNVYLRENQTVGVVEGLEKILHGVPIDLLRDMATSIKVRSLGIEPDDIVVVCPMRPEKDGFSVFVDAVDKIKKRLPNRQLKFIATAKARSRSARKSRDDANARGLDILFREYTLRQLWSVLRRAQVCVVPSFREGFSIVILEAMALGVPIVASEVHGNNEAIIDGETGLLFQAGKTDELAAKVVRILQDPNLSRDLSKAACERAATLFSAERMACEHIRLYEVALTRFANRTKAPA